MIEQQIAEATECDFKVALETRKPKSWLKSVSAFSNGIGGTLFFGISDDRKPVGLSNVQKDAEARFLTNAGKLMTDQHTVYNSRMFCTRWNGLGKGSIFDDALDDKEYDIHIIRSMRRNPVIADLFHRMKYMERRGSGLRKIISETEKLSGYTAAYKPEFSSTATDFRVILKNVNYQLSQKNLVSDQDGDQVSEQAKSPDIPHAVLDFCITEKSKQEICSFIGYRNLTYFTRKYLNPLLASGQLKMTIPAKPNSRKQKYITVRTE